MDILWNCAMAAPWPQPQMSSDIEPVLIIALFLYRETAKPHYQMSDFCHICFHYL